MEDEEFEDVITDDCPTGNCPGEPAAFFDPSDSSGDVDALLGLWEPEGVYTLERLIEEHSTPFLRFWMRLQQKYKELYGDEAFIRLAAAFSPGEQRTGYSELEWSDVGDPYTLVDPFEWDVYSTSSAAQFFGADFAGAAFSTSGGNWFRDRNEVTFHQDVEFDEMTDTHITLAARSLHQCMIIDEKMEEWLGVAGNLAMIALTTAALFTGVGGVVIAASVAMRAAAVIVLVIEINEAVALGTGYIGVREGEGVNVLENAFSTLGGSLHAADGEQAGRVAYATVNLIFGLNGKWRFLAAAPAAITYGAPVFLASGSGEEAEFWEQD